MPEISVIVPVYNVEKYLNRCIDSILAQTFKDIELILVDDGSTDNSGKICDEYAEKDSRVISIRKKNEGVSSSRNMGLSVAKGKYIMFCDSDDIVYSNWCLHMFNAIEKHKKSWVMCGCEYIDLKTEKTINSFVFDEERSFSVIDKKEYYKVYKLGISGSACFHIYNSSIIREHSLAFDESTDYAEDALFNCTYLNYCVNIYFLNEILYGYFISESQSLSHKYFSDYYDRVKKIYLSRKKLIDNKYLPDFCYDYFYHFNLALKYTLDKRNNASFIKKLKYNHYVINDFAFKECLDKMTIYKEDEKYVKLLQKGNYLLVYLRNKIEKGIR